MQTYTPATNTWSSLTPMTSGRQGAAFATIGDELHLFGGGAVAHANYSTDHFVYSP